MKKTFLGLTAIAAMASTATATTDTAWFELDQEIASLSSSVAGEDGLSVNATLANFYNSDSDNDEGGWTMKTARVNLKGKVEDISVKVSFDLGTGSAVLKDAYAKWSPCDGIQMHWGQFKRPFSYAFSVSSAKLLFYDVTASSKNESRDNGFMLSGDFSDGMYAWNVAATNGDDGATDELRLTGRMVANLAGNGGFHKHEGAIDGRDEMDASIGLSYASDDSAGMEFTKIGIDGAMTTGGMSLAFEMVDWDLDTAGSVTDSITGSDLDETTPFSVTASYLISENMEAAIRFEDFDDAADSSRLTVGFNFYTVLPHKAKWILNFQDLSSDSSAIESTVIRAGLVVSV